MVKREEITVISSDRKAGRGRKKNLDHLRGLSLVYGAIGKLKTQLLAIGDLRCFEDAVRINLLENFRIVERKFKVLLESSEQE
jgi:hypothetical protein